jgi:hypothetical protein
LVGSEHAQVAHDGLGNAQRIAGIVAAYRLRHQHIDPVARKDEARDRALHVDRHGHGAHSGAEGGGEEAAFTRLDERALRHRLAGGNGVADNRALQGLRIGLALKIISGLDEILWPGLEAEAVCLDDRADG